MNHSKNSIFTGAQVMKMNHFTLHTDLIETSFLPNWWGQLSDSERAFEFPRNHCQEINLPPKKINKYADNDWVNSKWRDSEFMLRAHTYELSYTLQLFIVRGFDKVGTTLSKALCFLSSSQIWSGWCLWRKTQFVQTILIPACTPSIYVKPS